MSMFCYDAVLRIELNGVKQAKTKWVWLKEATSGTSTNWNAVKRPPCEQQYCITMINVCVNITHGN